MRSFFDKNSDYFYFAFRVIVGVVFLLHGTMKVAGVTSGSMPLMSLMGLAMIIEVIGGVMLIFGLYSRYVALICAIEMIVAYFMVHIPNGFNPLGNGGEPATLFFAVFLVIMAYGSGRWSLDSAMGN